MAEQWQLRHGTTNENNTFTGAIAEISVDTTTHELRVHDGSTVGGHIIPTKAEVYTQTQADNLLSAKANSSSVYTKTEADNLLSAKANSSNVYTKAEVDALLETKPTTGHEVIAFQAPTAQNNYTWYRKYADGWVEQGGTSPSSSTNTTVTINLPITMANVYYQITQSSTANYDTIVTNMNGWGVDSKGTSSFIMWNRTGTSNKFDWVVYGMAA